MSVPDSTRIATGSVSPGFVPPRPEHALADTKYAARLAITHVQRRDDLARLTWSDGAHDVFHALWLRDNCVCPACRHPGNGQKLFDITSLAADVTLAEAATDAAGNLVVHFAPDGHRSLYTPAWLRDHSYTAASATPRRTLWDASLTTRVPDADYDDLRSHPAMLAEWMQAVHEYGLARVHGVPCEPGMVAEVASLFGYVRETNYGRCFDVRSTPAPINLAYTGLGLSVHTDNPYRDPVPGLQLLHCLRSESDGGQSVVVDGFAAAARLRAEDPNAFSLLTRFQVPFRYRSADADLCARGYLIETDDRGDVVAVRYNNRSVAAFDVPAYQMQGFYHAYRAFTGILFDAAMAVQFQLVAGDLFIVDNRRVLHGRKAFTTSGVRHLQGCYADLDSLRSRLQVLHRRGADA